MNVRFARGACHAVAFLLAGVWTYGENRCEAVSPTRLASVFTNSNGGSEYVVVGYDDGSGQNLEGYTAFVCTPGNCWGHDPDYICGHTGTHPGGSPIMLLNSVDDGDIHLIFISGGSIWETVWHDGPGICENSNPQGYNLTDETGSPAPYSQPNTAGYTTYSSLSGFRDSNNYLHIFYIAQDKSLHELYRDTNANWWRGYPPGYANAFGGRGMSAFFNGNENIFVTGTDNNLWVVWFDSNGWHTQQMTGNSFLNPPLTTNASPANFITTGLSAGNPVIWGPSTNGLLTIVELAGSAWYSGAFQGSGTPALDLTLSPTLTMPGTGWPYYIGSDGHMHSPNNGQDITAQFGGPPGEPIQGREFSPLTGGVDTRGTEHLFYIGNDHLLHEYYGDGTSWSTNTVSSVKRFP